LFIFDIAYDGPSEITVSLSLNNIIQIERRGKLTEDISDLNF